MYFIEEGEVEVWVKRASDLGGAGGGGSDSEEEDDVADDLARRTRAPRARAATRDVPRLGTRGGGGGGGGGRGRCL